MVLAFDSQCCSDLQRIVSEGEKTTPEDVNLSACGELFAGCGGMATGLAQAGFSHEWMVEFNPVACETLRRNFGALEDEQCLRVLQEDVRGIDWSLVRPIDFLAGGPPCQPFSKGGRSRGESDARDMWSEAVRAVKDLHPRGFLFENVKGLLRPAFSEYLQRILDSLRRGGNSEADAPDVYDVTMVSVNATDYGAGQKRERVLIAGLRADCGVLTEFPRGTHSIERLVWEKWVSGQYWDKHALPRPSGGPVSRAEQAVLRELKRVGVEPQGLPWQTCRDAFVGLGEPKVGASPLMHEYRAGARAYPGHEGSPIDEPAKALKAGCHGVPGGENMIIADGGVARYFTVREAARLQGLPDSFMLDGSWSQAMRQLGNAMPAHLAVVAGRWLRECADSKLGRGASGKCE